MEPPEATRTNPNPPEPTRTHPNPPETSGTQPNPAEPSRTKPNAPQIHSKYTRIQLELTTNAPQTKMNYLQAHWNSLRMQSQKRYTKMIGHYKESYARLYAERWLNPLHQPLHEVLSRDLSESSNTNCGKFARVCLCGRACIYHLNELLCGLSFLRGSRSQYNLVIFVFPSTACQEKLIYVLF